MTTLRLAGATEGLIGAIRGVYIEWRIQRMHSRGLRAARRHVGPGLKLNIGCGPNRKTGWLNIDLSGAADICLDLREPLPFGTSSIDAVYSEHFFEHLEYPREAVRFLQECFRVLRAGGSFSIGVPDTEWPIRAYAGDNEDYFAFVRENWHPSWCDTRMHCLNYHFRQGGEHKYAYDYMTLSRALAAAGFADIRRRQFDPETDSTARERGTLYVDARKLAPP